MLQLRRLAGLSISFSAYRSLLYNALYPSETDMHVVVPDSLVHLGDSRPKEICSVNIKGGKANAQMPSKHAAKELLKNFSTLLDVSSSLPFNKYCGQLRDPSNISTQARHDAVDFRSIQKLLRIHP